MAKFVAFLWVAVLPIAAIAQDPQPGGGPPPAPPTERATGQSQPAALTSPQAGSAQAAPDGLPAGETSPPPVSPREADLERELAGQVIKARSLVTKLDGALKKAQSSEDRARLRRELAEAQTAVADLELKVADAGTQLEAAETEIADERAAKDALAREKDRVADEKQKLASENFLLGKNIQYTALVAGILIALGALVATFFVLRWRNRSRKLASALVRRQQEEEKRSSAEDWVLTGQSGRLKLRGPLLASNGRGSIVGRGQTEADVIINDKDDSVSRRHARFFYRDNALYVEDLRSLNGTFVNGKRVNAGRTQPVQEQDELRFGNLNFILRRASS